MPDTRTHSVAYYGAIIGAWLVAGPAFLLAIGLLFAGSIVGAVIFVLLAFMALGIGDFIGSLFDRVKARPPAP